jgi:hypothetical protein
MLKHFLFFILEIFILLRFIGCSSGRIINNYWDIDTNILYADKLSINNDSTFTYTIYSSLHNTQSIITGRLHAIGKNEFVIESKLQPVPWQFSEIASGDSLFISVIDLQKRPIKSIMVCFFSKDSDLFLETNSSGIVGVPKHYYDSVWVHTPMFACNYPSLRIVELSSDSAIACLSTEILFYVNERLRLKGNTIEFLSSGKKFVSNIDGYR